ncbi:hypothetical protein V9T40_005492 [Parthenolecanium corni]|uniref:Uncharacterized protein n=1 Tax=Parthenolecanium corni TaxID=536013 RepID=A0AAN9Y4T8_9HEMI
MGSGVANDSSDEDRGISAATLSTLRGILISSLPRENAPVHETAAHARRKVTFQESYRKNGENRGKLSKIFEISEISEIYA